MRVNIYAEEITKDTVVLCKIAKPSGAVFHGCRLMLSSTQDLPVKEGEDARSAVTFWFKDEDEKVRDRFADSVLGALRAIIR